MARYTKTQAKRAYRSILQKAGGLYLNQGGASYFTVDEVVAITKQVDKAARRMGITLKGR